MEVSAGGCRSFWRSSRRSSRRVRDSLEESSSASSSALYRCPAARSAPSAATSLRGLKGHTRHALIVVRGRCGVVVRGRCRVVVRCRSGVELALERRLSEMVPGRGGRGAVRGVLERAANGRRELCAASLGHFSAVLGFRGRKVRGLAPALGRLQRQQRRYSLGPSRRGCLEVLRLLCSWV